MFRLQCARKSPLDRLARGDRLAVTQTPPSATADQINAGRDRSTAQKRLDEVQGTARADQRIVLKHADRIGTRRGCIEIPQMHYPSPAVSWCGITKETRKVVR